MGVRLGVGHLLACDDNLGDNAQQVQGRQGRSAAAAGGDRPGDASMAEPGEQPGCPRQRPHLGQQALERRGVRRLQFRQLLGSELPSRLAQQRVDQQARAHPDAPVDAPDGEVDAQPGERFTPGQHVLVHGVDQRAVEVEQHGRPGLDLVAHRPRCYPCPAIPVGFVNGM